MNFPAPRRKLILNTVRRAEWEYLRAERLGNLCPAGVPTAEQVAIAEGEADERAVKDCERRKP